MKNKLIATLLLGATVLAALSLVTQAATTEVKSKGKVTSIVMSGITNETSFTLNEFAPSALQVVSAIVSFDTSVTSTATVQITRGTIDQAVATSGSFTGTDDLFVPASTMYLHPGEVLKLDPGVTNLSVFTVHLLTP